MNNTYKIDYGCDSRINIMSMNSKFDHPEKIAVVAVLPKKAAKLQNFQI